MAETPETPPEPQGEQPGADAAPAAPAHRGPPIEVAVEVLDARGEETAALLKHVVATYVLDAGGRDDIPWVRVAPENLVESARRCRDDTALGMDLLHCLLAVDYVERIELDYVLFSLAGNRKAILKVDLPPVEPKIDTVGGLWEAANWYERETHDLFGVEFTGNPDLSPLLLYEGFEGHPGLKSFPLHDYEEW
ncbi:MAG: NADH-quinone oxidoreductase subunit C [Chloroflexi bacterium]|nr:NADH-quinone oxidoreductase subunit C [Chloroflexota bacterium]MCH7655309.1 NADH-quinone oxidoreductase subunit C [Chloroflexota bacterium]